MRVPRGGGGSWATPADPMGARRAGIRLDPSDSYRVGDAQAYSLSQTPSSWQFRKWLGEIVQPRTFVMCGTIRFH
jgi:hypothetical protein